MSLIEKFDELMSHLNGEENGMAEEFKVKLLKHIKDAEKDSLWRQCLENGGVDDWAWFSESLQDGGYFDEDEDS